jgi:hypothetical protein
MTIPATSEATMISSSPKNIVDLRLDISLTLQHPHSFDSFDSFGYGPFERVERSGRPNDPTLQ